MQLTITASNKNRFQPGTKQTDLFIKSLQWQTCKDFEFVLSDGGSDNYKEVKEYLENYDGDVPMRVVRNPIGDAFLRSFSFLVRIIPVFPYIDTIQLI